MELKVSALLLVASLLVQIPASRAKPTEEELINKKVSVNLPKRVASPVSHFDPATHHYAAEASVIINRVVPSVETFKPPQIEIPEPPQNLAKKLFVRSPEKSYSQDRHFDPALHDYEAEGLVLINLDSPLLTTQQHIFEPSHNPTLEGKPKNSIVKKTVVVKSSHGNTPVVSHFHPAPHIYAAVGDVLIDKTASNAFDGRDSPQTSNFLSGDEREISSSQRVSTFSNKTPQQYATRESVRKSVTVKIPEHRISNINHFNPAGHKYAARGEVNIDRENLGNKEQYKKENHQTVRSTSHHSNKRRAVDTPPIIRKAAEKYNYQQGQATKTGQSNQAALAVKKQVSVQLPEHRISSVNHFNPAGHTYAAQGGVVIDRDLSKSPISIISTKKQPRKSNVSHLKTTTRQKLNINQASKKDEVSVRIPFHSTPNRIQLKPSPSGLSVKKKVSVKLPEHRISHINHFNPAGHRYAAQGGVEIDRDALSTQGLTPSPRRPSKPDVNIFKTSPRRPVQVQVTQQKLKPVIQTTVVSKSPKPTKLSRQPQNQIDKIGKAPFQSIPRQTSLKPSSPSLSVKKQVSVQLPEHRISHINHFNPAGHQYAAAGGVEIDRQASLSPQGLTPSPRRPSKPVVNIFKTSPRRPVQVQVTQPKLKPVIQTTVVSKSPKRTKLSRQPQNQIDKIVKAPFQSIPRQTSLKPSSPSLSVKKQVSVQLPEHRISHINHFNPAGHQYAAAGGVEIDRQASLSPQGLTTSPRRPSKPDVTIFKTSPRRPVQVQVTQPKPVIQTTVVSKSPKRTPFSRQPQRQIDDDKIVQVPFKSTPRRPSLKPSSPGLSIKKKVSVQLPEHRISHINHFNPAGHHYDAAGGVEIDRDASIRPQGLAPVQRRPSKPDVNIFKTSPRRPVQVQVTQPKSVIQRTVVSKSPKRTPISRQPQRQIVDDKIVQVPFKSSPRRPSFQPSSQSLSVKKQVSVQLPEHRISHINHFNPTGHRYAAAGGVEIDRDSSLRPQGLTPVQRRPSKPDVNIKTSPRRPIQVQVTQPKPIIQTTVVSKSPKRTQISRLPQRQIDDDDDDKLVQAPFQSTPRRPSFKPTSPGLSIKKEVSVQLPEHRISHINHFNPAGHHYAAAGGVEIDREASLRPQGLTPVQRRPSKPDINIFKTSPRRPVQVQVTQPKPVIQRTVVSKSPKRTPISRQPQRQIVDDKILQVPFKSTPRRPSLKPSSPGLSIKKEVSVQLPEHRISHINHFNPTGHRYAAAGGVEIDRDASLRPQRVTPVQRRPSKPDVNIIKTSPRRPIQVKVTQPKPVIQTTVVSKSPKRTQISRLPQRQIDNDDDDKLVQAPFQSTPRRPSFKPTSPGLSIKKEVSVQLPEHRISHINHFNPAGHHYAAAGGVEIDRQASLKPQKLTPVQRRPSKPDINIFKTIPRRPVQVQVTQPKLKPAIQTTFVSKSPKRTPISRQPQRQIDADKIVQVPFKSTPRRPSLKPSSPGLSIKKEVSVQLPEHRISHINHFNPTSHRYAAAGGVEIDRDTSLRPQGLTPVQRRPSKPNVNIIKTSPRRPIQVQVTQPKPIIQTTVVSKSPKRTQISRLPQRQIDDDDDDKLVQAPFQSTPRRPSFKPTSPGLSIKKEVSVQLPEHRISHINHFNPAGHHYAAAGGVEIDREASLRPQGLTPVQRRPSKPDINIFKTSPRRPVQVQVTQPKPVIQRTVVSKIPKPAQISSVAGSVDIDKDVPPTPAFIPVIQEKPITSNVNTFTTKLTQPAQVGVKTSAAKPVDTKSFISQGPKPIPTIRQPQRQTKPKDKIVQVSHITAPTRHSLKSSGPDLFVKKEVSVQLPEHRISHINHFNPAGHKYAAQGGVEITGKKPLRPVDSLAGIRIPGKLDLSALQTSPQSPSESDGQSSLILDFNAIPPKSLPPLSLPKVSIPQTFSSKKDTSSDSGVSSSEHTVDIDEEKKPAFDFGSAGTYDISDIASYLPPIPDSPQVSVKKIDVQTSPKKSLVSLPGRNRFQLNKEVSVKSPDHGSSVIDHFSPAVPKYKASNKVTISRGD